MLVSYSYISTYAHSKKIENFQLHRKNKRQRRAIKVAINPEDPEGL
jgi:hypothetical protein